MSAFQPPARHETQPVFFPYWKEARQGVAIPAAQREGHQREILEFLRHC